MVKAIIYSKSGAKKAEPVALDKALFEQTPNHGLLDSAYRAYLAAGRQGAPAVKNRGDVRGGGKKPWKQKGTGRARVGSSRVPNWRGGGVVFGPTGLENHAINLSAAVKRAAIRQALSIQAAAGNVTLLEAFDGGEGRVKPTVELLGKLNLGGRVLLVVNDKNALIDRATRNIAGLVTVQAKYLNVFDLLNADKVIIDQKALEILHEWLAAGKPVASAKQQATSAKRPASRRKPTDTGPEASSLKPEARIKTKPAARGAKKPAAA